jgi:hypothetical protein
MLNARKAVYCGLAAMAFMAVAAVGFGQAKDLVTDKSQWTRVGFPPAFTVTKVEQWHIDPVKHVIVCDGNGGHDWLRFNQEFANFKFHVDWKFTKIEGETKYNSGVFFRNSADGVIWHQAQTTLGGGYIFGETIQGGKKVKFNYEKEMKENRVKPAGEWNAYDITCIKDACTLAVNGVVVNTLQTDVAKGYVGLESEGYQITFKNVKIQELP